VKQTGQNIQILVVEDNDTMRDGMVQILKKSGYRVSESPSGNQALELLKIHEVDLVITDYKMAGIDGLELLKRIKKDRPECEVLVITAFGTIDLAVEVMKSGAWDFIPKPFSKDALLLKVNRVVQMIRERKETSQLSEENAYLKSEENTRFNFGEIIGESKKMQTIYKTIQKISASESSVLILGESGTGKELVARAIHSQSVRKNKPFIRVNCGALAEGVLESELFGHEKGAFTGALRKKKGRFELAHHGTLFLDEIGDLPLNTQVKLLRVLQEKEFERVGGEETLQVDVRLIAATHRNLMDEVEKGRFREDLYYRLYILPIHLPPLRERKEDIPLLADHFLKQLGQEMQKPAPKLQKNSLDPLLTYNWPGNIRELSNVLERALVLSEGDTINGEELRQMLSHFKGTEIADTSLDLNKRLAAVEKECLIDALKTAKGVKARAARILGIKESALYYKLEKYNLLEKR